MEFIISVKMTVLIFLFLNDKLRKMTPPQQRVQNTSLKNRPIPVLQIHCPCEEAGHTHFQRSLIWLLCLLIIFPLFISSSFKRILCYYKLIRAKQILITVTHRSCFCFPYFQIVREPIYIYMCNFYLAYIKYMLNCSLVRTTNYNFS